MHGEDLGVFIRSVCICKWVLPGVLLSYCISLNILLLLKQSCCEPAVYYI